MPDVWDMFRLFDFSATADRRRSRWLHRFVVSLFTCIALVSWSEAISITCDGDSVTHVGKTMATCWQNLWLF